MQDKENKNRNINQISIQSEQSKAGKDKDLEPKTKKSFFANRSKPYRKYALAIVIVIFMIFGAGVKYARFVEGQPLVQTAIASNIIQVESFASEVTTASIIVKISGEAGKTGYFALDNQTSLRDLLEYVGVKNQGDIADFDLTYKPMQGDEFYIKDKHNPVDSTPWLTSTTAQANNSLETTATNNEDLININTADLQTLDSLPGIGPAKAQAIIDYRKTHGSFVYKEDILGVKGIGEKIYEELADKITV